MRAREVLAELAEDPGVTWGVCVLGAERLELRPDEPLSAASVGKLLLLVEVAERMRASPAWGAATVCRTPADEVADSGLWQHLSLDCLPVRDAAVLVAAHSDNLATNVLLREVGLEAVERRARSLGLRRTALHDRVRDRRGPGMPERLSTGTARELAGLALALEEDEGAGRDVVAWLRAGTDLSMVPAGLALDPLAHALPDRGWLAWSKTGTDAGVRADVGVIRRGERLVAYAAIANWPAGADDPRDRVLDGMRRLGAALASPLRG